MTIYKNLKIGVVTASYVEICSINDALLIEILNTNASDEFNRIISNLYNKTEHKTDFNCNDIQKRKPVAMIKSEKFFKTKFIDHGIYNQAIYCNNKEATKLLNEHMVKIKAVRWYSKFKPKQHNDFTWYLSSILGLVIWYGFCYLQYITETGG